MIAPPPIPPIPADPHVRVSTHAKRRFKLRTGLPARAARAAARRALVDGRPHTDLHPHTRAVLDAKLLRHQPEGRAFIYLHGNLGYVFVWQNLETFGLSFKVITVLNMSFDGNLLDMEI
jgi:hypothetical protein